MICIILIMKKIKDVICFFSEYINLENICDECIEYFFDYIIRKAEEFENICD